MAAFIRQVKDKFEDKLFSFSVSPGPLYIQSCAQFLLVQCQLAAVLPSQTDSRKKGTDGWWENTSYLFGKMHAWGKWVCCLHVCKCLPGTVVFIILFKSTHSWLFFFVFFKSTVLLSVLPTLDNLLIGFRQLGAKNKIRDVLYYQVKFMVSYQSMFVQTFYNYSLKDACAISCLMYTDTTKRKLFYFLTIQARIYDELGYLAERNQCATECRWILQQQTNTAIALALCVL